MMPVAMARPRQKPGSLLRSSMVKLLREARRAVETFDDDPCGKAHLIRTRVKRLQSLSRLVPHASLWREDFLRPCGELKDIFAPTRDATIVGALAEKYAPGRGSQLLKPPKPDLKAAANRVLAALLEIGRFSGWQAADWEGIADRATGTYRAARNAWKQARRKNASDTAFHEWRRRLKRLLYQCEYLGGRARLARFTARVDRLGEILGEIQDVCLAESWLQDQGLHVPADLARSKEVLRHDAVRRGKSLLVHKPKDFRRMLK
ncbi:MAG: CHAD domain-containing protein [Chthoniobacterales bacterium]|nr:CHAD domain-containing protein [Chthoniobacterales bacterium]